MALTLSLGSLSSRAARIASVGSAGIRRIAVNATTEQEDDDNALVNFYQGLEKFGQSLMRTVLQGFAGIFSFSWSKLWGQITSGTLFLINFNWNITNKELDEQIKQAEVGLAAARGSLAGQSLGYAICGVIPTATIAVFNEPLALYMMKELGEEAADEIAASLTTLLTLQFQQQVRRQFAALFKNYRTLLRGAAVGFAQILVAGGILTQDSVDKANKKRNEPWSFASALEESIESIKDPAEQAYTEEFWEEFQDSCIEAGFIIAGAADSYFAQQKMANASIFGSERTIEIEPIRTQDDED